MSSRQEYRFEFRRKFCLEEGVVLELAATPFISTLPTGSPSAYMKWSRSMLPFRFCYFSFFFFLTRGNTSMLGSRYSPLTGRDEEDLECGIHAPLSKSPKKI